MKISTIQCYNHKPLIINEIGYLVDNDKNRDSQQDLSFHQHNHQHNNTLHKRCNHKCHSNMTIPIRYSHVKIRRDNIICTRDLTFRGQYQTKINILQMQGNQNEEKRQLGREISLNNEFKISFANDHSSMKYSSCMLESQQILKENFNDIPNKISQQYSFNNHSISISLIESNYNYLNQNSSYKQLFLSSLQYIHKLQHVILQQESNRIQTQLFDIKRCNNQNKKINTKKQNKIKQIKQITNCQQQQHNFIQTIYDKHSQLYLQQRQQRQQLSQGISNNNNTNQYQYQQTILIGSINQQVSAIQMLDQHYIDEDNSNRLSVVVKQNYQDVLLLEQNNGNKQQPFIQLHNRENISNLNMRSLIQYENQSLCYGDDGLKRSGVYQEYNRNNNQKKQGQSKVKQVNQVQLIKFNETYHLINCKQNSFQQTGHKQNQKLQKQQQQQIIQNQVNHLFDNSIIGNILGNLIQEQNNIILLPISYQQLNNKQIHYKQQHNQIKATTLLHPIQETNQQQQQYSKSQLISQLIQSKQLISLSKQLSKGQSKQLSQQIIYTKNINHSQQQVLQISSQNEIINPNENQLLLIQSAYPKEINERALDVSILQNNDNKVNLHHHYHKDNSQNNLFDKEIQQLRNQFDQLLSQYTQLSSSFYSEKKSSMSPKKSSFKQKSKSKLKKSQSQLNRLQQKQNNRVEYYVNNLSQVKNIKIFPQIKGNLSAPVSSRQPILRISKSSLKRQLSQLKDKLYKLANKIAQLQNKRITRYQNTILN